MAYSCSSPNISRCHVDTTVPQLIADLRAGVLIKVPFNLVAAATVDGRGMMGDLLIAFACIGRPQFVEAFEVVLMEDLPCGADDPLLEIEVLFVRRKQVAATLGRYLFGVPERFANMVIHHDPARCCCAAAATFGAILDVDLAVLFGLTF